MTFNFKYETKPMDIWQLNLYGLYSSIPGMINLLISLCLLVLATKYWGNISLGLRIGVIAGLVIFLVIQPLMMYSRAKKQVKQMPKHIELGMDESGVHVNDGHEAIDIQWKDIEGIAQKPTMLILLSTSSYGYILVNRVLKGHRKEVFNFVQKMMIQHKKR